MLTYIQLYITALYFIEMKNILINEWLLFNDENFFDFIELDYGYYLDPAH